MTELKTKKIKYYEDEAFWFTKASGVLTIGITQSCLMGLGTVEDVQLPDEGTEVDQGENLVSISGSEGEVVVTAPAGGTIVEVNTQLEGGLELINEDPDGEGWLLRIEYHDETELEEQDDDSDAEDDEDEDDEDEDDEDEDDDVVEDEDEE